mmetsp:Transcript_26159/g.51209  ORF Transcript_26159/g.51209 Transcript_26159/m.51209 type:complete len:502 (+) Transcript_26159:77-1582(+)
MASAMRSVATVAVAACVGHAATHRHPNFEPPPAGAVRPYHTPGGTVVELFEWAWPDVARECEEWLGPKGFNAVQVSPVNDHVAQLEWWARYKPVTFELVSRSGDEKAFVDMVQRCNKVGVGVYVDVVFNHIAAGSGLSVGGKSYGNRTTPTFDQNDLHHYPYNRSSNCKVSNYMDKTNVQHCDLWGLPDLCTECESVQKKVVGFLTKLAKIGVAGFRVDASKHINAGELAQIKKKTSRNGLYWFQEVFASKWEAVTVNEYTNTGALEYFQYARKISPAFAKAGQLSQLNKGTANWNFVPSDKAVVFLDNHDTQRTEAPLTFRDGRVYELATIFMLGHPFGYPKVMSSYYFETHDQGRPEGPVHDMDRLACTPSAAAMEKPLQGRPWVCEHRWHTIANMVAWRRSAGNADISTWWAMDGNRLFFCRGKRACLAINRHETEPWKANLKFGLPEGMYCDVFQSDNTTSCPTVNIERDGRADIEVQPLTAVAVHLGKMAARQFLV